MMSFEEIKEKEERYSTGVYPKRDIVIKKGKGAYLWDINGKKYVDCVGGHGSANVGHCNPYVASAVKEQLETLTSCTEIFLYEKRALLLEELAKITPTGIEKFFLCNSGAEANEAAFKFVRMLTGKNEIIATVKGFHGRTFGALSATWEKKYREYFYPLVPGFSHIPYNNLDALKEAVNENTAAFIIEVIQGEGGIRIGDEDYLRGVQKFLKEKGVLFIIDEVQTGFGRTGAWFASDLYGLEPDIITMAKSMGGGIPVGAMGIGANLENVKKLSHGSTFGGNPIAVASSLAVIKFIKDNDIINKTKELGRYFIESLKEISSPLIREVRGKGLMIGIEIKTKATPFLKKLADQGVLALPAGRNVLRFLPPLVIEKDDIDFVVEKVNKVLKV